MTPAERHNGFTLIELLVALMISSILAAIVFQFLGGQARFVEHQSAREETQQTTRGALELITNELRAIPPEGVEKAELGLITARVPRFWGVVCLIDGVNIHLALPTGFDPSSFSVSASADYRPYFAADVQAVGGGGPAAWIDPVRVEYADDPASNSCLNLTAGVESRRVQLQSDISASLAVGNPAYVYDRITYFTDDSDSYPGLWIKRRKGTDAAIAQPVAGPVSNGGLAFDYYNGANPAVELDNFGTDGLAEAEREAIARVDVIVSSESDRADANDPMTRTDTAAVSFRSQ